jgi:hypothetical protein
MKDEVKERWLYLCALAANEQDPRKLIALVEEINRLLAEQRERPRILPKTDDSPKKSDNATG